MLNTDALFVLVQKQVNVTVITKITFTRVTLSTLMKSVNRSDYYALFRTYIHILSLD